MEQSWALFIDIQGFAAKWDDTTMNAFRGINALMQGVFWIGDRYYRNQPDRLFAYQFGDGFLVSSEFHESRLDRAVLIAVSLLRHLLSIGETAKCSISEGRLADVQGCYPKEIQDRLRDSNIELGEGIMIVTPVLGSALVNSVKLQKRAPSGPLLVIREQDRNRVPADIEVKSTDSGLLSLNWLLGDTPGLSVVQSAAGFVQHSEAERITQLQNYIDLNGSLSDTWRNNVKTHLFNAGI